MTMTMTMTMTTGDRILIIGDHPWATHAGTLIAYEKYGLGWYGWRIKLDGNCGECYANADQLHLPSHSAIRKGRH